MHDWFYSLVGSESWDDTEHEYYKGSKQKRMYKFFNEEGWNAFARVGFKSNKWERHTMTLYVKACRRVLTKDDVYDVEKTCSAFENGAEKYGFYYPPYVEPSIEVQVEEVQKQIEEQLFMFK